MVLQHAVWVVISRYMHRQASKKETNKYHDRSLDDFIKNVKRYNLKSERYDRLHSPDQFGPYRNNTAHTLQRSRTLSAKQSRKTNKTTRQKVERMLNGSVSREKHRGSGSKMGTKTNSSKVLPDPADLVFNFSKRIGDTLHFLQGKSKMGVLLCRKFIDMLNEIVENMLMHMQKSTKELEKIIFQRVERQMGERAERKMEGMQRKLAKLQRQTFKLLEKQNYNNNLIYHLRLKNIDIDQQFGKCVFKSDSFGGLGYQQKSQLPGHSQLIHPLSNSQLVYIPNEEQAESSDPNESVGRGEDWQWSPAKKRERSDY